MRSYWKALLMGGALLGVIALVGCGGKSSGPSTPSPFAGTFVLAVMQDGERIDSPRMVVAANGSIRLSDPTDTTLSGTGSVTEAGALTATVRSRSDGQTTTAQITGTLSKQGDAVSGSGTFTVSGGGGSGTWNIDNSPMNPFAGIITADVYQGNTKTGTFDTAVEFDGTATLSAPDDDTFSGSGTVSMAGVVNTSCRFTDNGQVITVQITGQYTKSGSSVTGSGDASMSNGETATWRVTRFR